MASELTLVERLRDLACGHDDRYENPERDPDLLREAADRIEVLEKALLYALEHGELATGDHTGLVKVCLAALNPNGK